MIKGEQVKKIKKDSLEFVRFKSSINELKKKKILQKMHGIVMSSSGWLIYSPPRYHQLKRSQVFEHIQGAFCTSLSIWDVGMIEFPRQIAFPKFSRLRYLNLRSNGIQNIEALCFLDVELVRQINLEINQITNLKPMDKLSLQHLSAIKFLQNPIESYFQISRMKCNWNRLDLDLATNAKGCSRYQVETFNFFPKIPTKAIFFTLNKHSNQVRRKC